MALASVLKFIQSPVDCLYPFDELPTLKTRAEDARVDEMAQKIFLQNHHWQKTKYVCKRYFNLVSISSLGLASILNNSSYLFLGPYFSPVVGVSSLAIEASTFFIDYRSPLELKINIEEMFLTLDLQVLDLQQETHPFWEEMAPAQTTARIQLRRGTPFLSEETQTKLIELIRKGASVDTDLLEWAARYNSRQIIDYLVSIGVPSGVDSEAPSETDSETPNEEPNPSVLRRRR